jgi:hypothetical protein
MTPHRCFQVCLLGLLLVGCLKVASAQDQVAAEARHFADAEWQMFDAGSYATMFDTTFDDSMKQQGKDQWLQIAKSVAQQRGKMISRTLANATASMGMYRFIYSSQCAGGKVFEDITVTKKSDGWKVMGLYVRPNLE